MLFTGDLRVRDQPALTAAVDGARETIPAFVLDDRLLAGSCGAPNRLAFLLECLRDLDASLRQRGGALVVRRGDVIAEALALARRWHAQAIYLSEDLTPYARARERRLAQACAEQRIALHVVADTARARPGELVPTGGDHYRVFTPYWRVWSGLPRPAPRRAPRHLAVPASLRSSRLPALARLTSGTPSPQLLPGGESAGRARLERWLRGDGAERYAQTRDDLPAEDTSRLSAYLHFGCLSAASVDARCAGRAGSEPFLRQLCWRDFHRQVLAARPDLPHADYRPRGDRWRRDRRAAQAWREGHTGYPIVDAGMRQLAREGYMHNRARLIVASFLTKTLYLDWRLGAAHFASLLLDADVAANVGNWQWVAGTGNDTRPNRVLSPLRQAHRFDPDGEYVRRYVPELASLPGALAHEPWRLPAAERGTLDYPAPIVDHRGAAEELRRRRSASRARGARASRGRST